MKRIRKTALFPSATCFVPRKDISCYIPFVDNKKNLKEGDLIYGEIVHLGQHNSLENRHGRIHAATIGTKGVFVLGNRYAPDYYEGTCLHSEINKQQEIDLLARSGLVGNCLLKNDMVKDCSRIKVLGYISNNNGSIINTRDYPKLKYRENSKKPKIILSIGSSMNSGKSQTAAMLCRCISLMGKTVTGAKITGTASLKDILLMEDYGANKVFDFTFLGYPSTYLLNENELLNIFNTIYSNSSSDYIVVEIADGILQRETSMLLSNAEFVNRMYKIVFSTNSALGGIGGVETLRNKFNINIDAISGVISSSPLAVAELSGFCDMPVIHNIKDDIKTVGSILDI